MSDRGSILVGLDGKAVLVKVRGRGDFSNSSSLSEFVKEMMHRGHRTFVFDLAKCDMMDSTFMGTLAGIGLRLREVGQGEAVICAANARNRELLENLGLDHVLTVLAEGATPWVTSSESVELEKEGSPNAETMLEAHEALVEAQPENLAQFKDVLDYLRQDLQKPGQKP
ncbi:MAG: STAS domain-containing protein [Verrucomicrobiales bacterium]